MHAILRVKMVDTLKANEAINNGSLQKIFETISKEINPEASFFYSDGGYRTGLYIFDLKNVADIPQICEPFFMGLNAQVEIFPTMSGQELAQGLSNWNKKSSSYPSFQTLS